MPNLQIVRFASALRDTLNAGYGLVQFRADLLAGITVGIVALPLAMALAIASGVPPQHGLYTAIIAGGLIALTGGSRYNVSGPTAAFVVILHPISVQYGIGGLLLATLMAGVIMIIMGVARLGRLIQFIPFTVTTGFTSGIAVVIASLQFKDFFGLPIGQQQDSFFLRLAEIVQNMPGMHLPDLVIGVVTLMVLIIWRRMSNRIPSHIVAVVAGTLASLVVIRWWPGFEVATLGSRFHYDANGLVGNGIPPLPPLPLLPWHLAGPDGQAIHLNLELLRELLGPAFAIAMLGAIESLLCAVVADGMTGTRHNPNAELIGQGLGNVVAPFFGGIAATGAIARTATNIRAGSQGPLSAFMHAIFVLLSMLVLAPFLSYLPMAALAALLLMVAWNISEVKHFVHVLLAAPRSDIAVLLTCFSLTVVFDMQIAVSTGVVLAAILFMKRMADIAHVKLMNEEHIAKDIQLPPGVLIYDIEGPLFFGAAEKAMSTLESIQGNVHTVILDMADVPVMDISGVIAMQSAIKRLHSHNIRVILAEVADVPCATLRKAGIKEVSEKLWVCKRLNEAIRIVNSFERVNPLEQ